MNIRYPIYEGVYRILTVLRCRQKDYKDDFAGWTKCGQAVSGTCFGTFGISGQCEICPFSFIQQG